MTRSAHPKATLLLRRARLPALLITDLRNIRYVSGLDVSAGCILVTKQGFTLYTDARYLEVAKAEAKKGITVCSLTLLADQLGKLGTVGIESENVTMARYTYWKKKYKNTKFVQTSGILEEFRRSKDPEELRCIRHACSITRSVLRLVPHLLKSGVTEQEIAWQLERECRKRGAEGMAFPSIVAFGEHTARPHHHPTQRRLSRGDLVQIDMGASYHGYCSDFSRVYFTVQPTVDQARALRALKEAKVVVEKSLRVGVTNRSLDRCAREVLKKYGYDKEFSHALGHGLGLDIHEGVTLSRKAPRQILKQCEVITIEPGLYFEGRWGMRIEDTIVVS